MTPKELYLELSTKHVRAAAITREIAEGTRSPGDGELTEILMDIAELTLTIGTTITTRRTRPGE